MNLLLAHFDVFPHPHDPLAWRLALAALMTLVTGGITWAAYLLHRGRR